MLDISTVMEFHFIENINVHNESAQRLVIGGFSKEAISLDNYNGKLLGMVKEAWFRLMSKKKIERVCSKVFGKYMGLSRKQVRNGFRLSKREIWNEEGDDELFTFYRINAICNKVVPNIYYYYPRY